MLGFFRVVALGAGLWALVAGSVAAQENLDAGKSGAQLFAANCAMCHKSPRGLAKSAGGLFGVEGFLKEHYTSSSASASRIADYLRSVDQGAPASERTRSAKPRTDEEKEKSSRKRSVKRGEPKPEDKTEKKPDEAKPADEKPAAEKSDSERPPAPVGEKKPGESAAPKQAESEFNEPKKPRKPKASAPKKDKNEEPPKSE